MKILFKISRMLIIFFAWTICYIYWFQSLMMSIWEFSPITKTHWQFIWYEWQSGWTLQSFSEWMFVFALFSMIPVWFTGFIALCAVPWFKWIKVILSFPIRLIKNRQKKKKEQTTAKPKVTKKKSYKQTRPPAVRSTTGKIKNTDGAKSEKTSKKSKSASSQPSEEQHQQKPQERTSSGVKSTGGTIMDILRNAGYRLISDAKIAGKKVDFVGVAKNHILLCNVDSEPGDWLADEERFNDEEPLWFSESNHRVSPVRIVLNAKDAIKSKLSAKNMDVKTAIIIKQGTIINAEDMFEVWNGLDVMVLRHEEGGPDEIKEAALEISDVSSADDDLFNSISSIFN